MNKETANFIGFKVSFDWDDCLADNEYLQQIAKAFMVAGIPVYILTARDNDPHIYNEDLFVKAMELGFDITHILFANITPKHLFMKQYDIDIHFDDNADTIDQINRYFSEYDSSNKRGFLVNLDLPDLINTYYKFKD